MKFQYLTETNNWPHAIHETDDGDLWLLIAPSNGNASRVMQLRIYGNECVASNLTDFYAEEMWVGYSDDWLYYAKNSTERNELVRVHCETRRVQCCSMEDGLFTKFLYSDYFLLHSFSNWPKAVIYKWRIGKAQPIKTIDLPKRKNLYRTHNFLAHNTNIVFLQFTSDNLNIISLNAVTGKEIGKNIRIHNPNDRDMPFHARNNKIFIFLGAELIIVDSTTLNYKFVRHNLRPARIVPFHVDSQGYIYVFLKENNGYSIHRARDFGLSLEKEKQPLIPEVPFTRDDGPITMKKSVDSMESKPNKNITSLSLRSIRVRLRVTYKGTKLFEKMVDLRGNLCLEDAVIEQLRLANVKSPHRAEQHMEFNGTPVDRNITPLEMNILDGETLVVDFRARRVSPLNEYGKQTGGRSLRRTPKQEKRALDLLGVTSDMQLDANEKEDLEHNVELFREFMLNKKRDKASQRPNSREKKRHENMRGQKDEVGDVRFPTDSLPNTSRAHDSSLRKDHPERRSNMAETLPNPPNDHSDLPSTSSTSFVPIDKAETELVKREPPPPKLSPDVEVQIRLAEIQEALLNEMKWLKAFIEQENNVVRPMDAESQLMKLKKKYARFLLLAGRNYPPTTQQIPQ